MDMLQHTPFKQVISNSIVNLSLSVNTAEIERGNDQGIRRFFFLVRRSKHPPGGV